MSDMRTCPDCGRELPDDETVCSLCGASAADGAGDPVPPTLGDTLDELTGRSDPAPARIGTEDGAAPAVPSFEEGVAEGFDAPVAEEVKPKKKAVVFVPIAVACAVALGLAVWLVSGLLGNPRDAFLRQHKAMIGEIMKNELSFAAKLGETKGYDLDATLTVTADGVDLGILEGNAIRLQVDTDENRVALDGSLLVRDEPVLSGMLRCELEADTMNMGFYLPELSDKYYVLDYLDMVEALTGETIPSDGKQNAASTHAVRERVIKTYGDILMGVVKKSNVTKQSGTYPMFYLRSSDWKATAYTFKPTAKDLEKLYLDLADALEKDRDLPRLVNGFDQMTRATLASSLRTGAAEAGQALAEAGFAWTIRENGHGMYQVEISWRDDGNDIWIRFERTGNSLYFGWLDYYADEPMESFAQWHEDDHGSDPGMTYQGNISLMNSVDIGFENIRPEKTSSLGVPYGNYTVAVSQLDPTDDLVALVVAAAAEGGTDHTLTLRIPNDTGEGDDIDEVTVNLHTTDAPVTLADPVAPVEDVTNYTAEDWEALGEELSENFYSAVFDVLFTSYLDS